MATGTTEARVQPLLPQVLKGNVRYAPAVRAIRWIFATGHNGLFDLASGAPSDVVRAHLPQWDTSKLRREADQIFLNLDAVMRAGGSGLENALRLDQNYTSGRAVEAYHDARRATMNDHIAPSTSTLVAGFMRPRQEIEVQVFPRGKPATTLVPTATPGFFLANARVEINTIALKAGAKTKREVIDGGVFPAFSGLPQAIRAGDLLLLSGLLAIDQNGLVDSAHIDPEQPYHGSSVQAQMDAMLESAAKICAAAGTSLANVVRVQQYHTDPAEFFSAYQAWERHLPISAVKVPFLPAPGCTVQLDLWVYSP